MELYGTIWTIFCTTIATSYVCMQIGCTCGIFFTTEPLYYGSKMIIKCSTVAFIWFSDIFLYILHLWDVFHSLISRRFIWFFPFSPMVKCSWKHFPIVHFTVSFNLKKKTRKQEKFVPGWGSHFRYEVDKRQYRRSPLKTITSWMTSGWCMANKRIIALQAGLSTPSIQLADYVYSKERKSMDIKARLWKPYLFHAVIAKRTNQCLLKQATR